jgi:hypothetical protein
MYYKAPDNSVHFLDDDSFISLLPSGSVPITDEEAEALKPAPAAPSAQSQISALEQSNLLPRVTREFMLLQFAAVAASQGIDPTTNIAYVKVKELDDQIAGLRSQL